MSLDLIRRVQIPMVTIWVAVEIGDDDGALDIQDDFEAALAALIETPISSAEDAGMRLRCLAQVGEYLNGCTSMAAQIYDGLRTIGDGLVSAERRVGG